MKTVVSQLIKIQEEEVLNGCLFYFFLNFDQLFFLVFFFEAIETQTS